jgi:predicted DNA-binding protein (MmcQ/YjbR family)
MGPDEALAYCLGLPGAWRDEPWEDVVVAKVGSRIFAFAGAGSTLGVKCGSSRDDADEWLHRHPEDSRPMPYLARSGWNSLALDGQIPEEELEEAIDASYFLVVTRLPKRERPAALPDR